MKPAKIEWQPYFYTAACDTCYAEAGDGLTVGNGTIRLWAQVHHRSHPTHRVALQRVQAAYLGGQP